MGENESKSDLTREIRAVGVKVDGLSEKVDTLNEIITGNGDPSTGMVVRLDRLEQNEKRRAKYVTAAVAASVAAVCKAFWATITGSNHS